MALEMRDFSLAARTAEGSTLETGLERLSPLLEPFSAECLLSASTSLFEENEVAEEPRGEGADVCLVDAAEVEAVAEARSVSGAIGVRGSMVGESPYMLA